MRGYLKNKRLGTGHSQPSQNARGVLRDMRVINCYVTGHRHPVPLLAPHSLQPLSSSMHKSRCTAALEPQDKSTQSLSKPNCFEMSKSEQGFMSEIMS